MGSSSATDSELHRRIRQQEVVATLGQQALETGDLEESNPGDGATFSFTLPAAGERDE